MKLSEEQKDILVQVLNTNDGCCYLPCDCEDGIKSLAELGVVEMADCSEDDEWYVSITEKGIEVAREVFQGGES